MSLLRLLRLGFVKSIMVTDYALLVTGSVCTLSQSRGRHVCRLSRCTSTTNLVVISFDDSRLDLVRRFSPGAGLVRRFSR